MWLFVAIAALSAWPSVSNVHASQREGTKLVDIRYNLSGAVSPVTIAVRASTNAGTSYDLSSLSSTGDVGLGVTNGVDRHVVWNAEANWDGQYSSVFRFKVSASDASAPTGFVLIPAGNFQMGDCFAEGYTDEIPVHTVYVSAFYMKSTEVSQAQWDEVRSWGLTNGYTDLPAGRGQGSNHPVHSINWFYVVKWCNARSEKEGLSPSYYTTSAKTTVYRTGSVDVANGAVDWNANGYRLPTEAEWEKAARGGSSGRRFPWSDANTITHSRANYISNPDYSYDVSPKRGRHPNFEFTYTSPVGYFAANGYGLYDLAGNGWEWCWDRYSSSYYGSSPSSNPIGPTFGAQRVQRGGEWSHYAIYCRVATRERNNPVGALDRYGFRPVRETVSGLSGTLAVDTRGEGILPSGADCDGDGCLNGVEYRAGTDPRDPGSRFEVARWSMVPNPSGTGVTCTVRWNSVEGRLYRVERSLDLSQWDIVADQVQPTLPMNAVVEEIVPAPAQAFYRVVVK
ncbi:MAG: SUMF1/EgtB/PvdO family nonheme iron enzyme [Verrucomicrobiae bacterium]|nr:SUMF1/EgtB/PvdO family nonheme iron enzyme [Verrucomicrobiae bacterium]